MEEKIARQRKGHSLPSSTSSLLSDKSDETQASLSLVSGVHSVVTNVASYATFNNCSINFILNFK